MTVNKFNGFALLLIACGVLIILDKVGFGLGNVAGLIIPVILIVLGYFGIKSGKVIVGTIVLIIGLIVLFGKMSGLIAWIIAVALIVWGYKLLVKRGRAV